MAKSKLAELSGANEAFYQIQKIIFGKTLIKP